MADIVHLATAFPLWPLLATLATQTLATMAAYSLPALAPMVAKDLDVPDATTFTRPDLTIFTGLDDLGLEVTGQLLEPDRAVLACRVLEPDDWCRRCGCQGGSSARCALIRIRLSSRGLRVSGIRSSLSGPQAVTYFCWASRQRTSSTGSVCMPRWV